MSPPPTQTQPPTLLTRPPHTTSSSKRSINSSESYARPARHWTAHKAPSSSPLTSPVTLHLSIRNSIFTAYTTSSTTYALFALTVFSHHRIFDRDLANWSIRVTHPSESRHQIFFIPPPTHKSRHGGRSHPIILDVNNSYIIHHAKQDNHQKDSEQGGELVPFNFIFVFVRGGSSLLHSSFFIPLYYMQSHPITLITLVLVLTE
ncbi:hypothetical protein SISNIDRAFT_489625 [Sistotremastrum niveocremeum HHB9708]|uniref:Uncharacterized protein n=1 Tax=Sistotremastrum niveocremeum HHB9708 TaxID=1314777 RepID=A0A164PRE6_9AGAM|nr:hypothetical protein SISNIDRAFT_489625 [Sistotremastrum niveocremeum HHB9708]